MGITRTLLRPAARLAGLRADWQIRTFMSAHERTVEVQDHLLRRLLDASAGSAFARDHGLAGVRTYADLASAVPIGDYETHRTYVERVMAGETDAMFAPGTEVHMFAATSGTTGRPKHIPVTTGFLREYRRGWNIFGMLALRDHKDGWLRKIVTVVSSARDSTADCGAPCGAISGLLAEKQMWIVRRMYPVPGEVREVRDPAAKYYLTLRAAITEDVGLITTANPSTAVKLAETACEYAERLIRDIHDGTCTPPTDLPGLPVCGRSRPDRAAAKRLQDILDATGQLAPKDFWNLRILAHWTGGTLGLYLPRVREFYGDVPIRDIGLLASEGRLSLPITDGTAAGVAEITANVLEFIPAGQIDSADPDVLRAHEVTEGEEYFIVLTNWAGLWRYNINDRVRVTGFVGASPLIEFLSKGQHISSITGEKLTEHQVVAAMAAAARDLETRVDTFTLQGRFADTPYYELRAEQVDGFDLSALAGRMDVHLRAMNMEYDGKRHGGRLGEIRVSPVPAGTFAAREAELIASRNGRSEQYKHKYLLTDVIDDRRNEETQ